METQPRLIPVAKWKNYHDYPSIGTLRQLIFRADENGFNDVIRRIGGRVLINEQAFFEWVERINGKEVVNVK